MPLIPSQRFHGLIILLMLLAAPAVVTGQETYELTDGEFEKVSQLDPTTPEGQLQNIRRLIAAGEGGDAEDLADDWIGDNLRHPGLPEAYLLRADAKVAQEDYYEALFDYEFLVRNFPDSEHFHTALEREYEIAKIFAGGLNRRLLGMRIIPAEAEGEELLIRVQERSPGSDLAERAGLLLADHYYRVADMRLAAEAYALFVENYPASNHVRRARIRQIEANLATFKGPNYDATGLVEARAQLENLEAVDPLSAEQVGSKELTVRIDESLAEKQLIVGQWYETQEKTVSAELIYRRIVATYPDSRAAFTARGRLHELRPNKYDAPPGYQPRESGFFEQTFGDLFEDDAEPDASAPSAGEPAEPPAVEQPSPGPEPEPEADPAPAESVEVEPIVESAPESEALGDESEPDAAAPDVMEIPVE